MGKLDRVRFGGKTVDRRTADMLREAERLAQDKDPSIRDFTLNQGSFSHSVSASGGTHGGPGAFDLSTRGYSDDQTRIIGLALRRVGFASWLRTPDQGDWGEHFHGIAIGTKGLPKNARNQVQNYLDGRTGLRGGGVDDQARPRRILTWEEYQVQGARSTTASGAGVARNDELSDRQGDPSGIVPEHQDSHRHHDDQSQAAHLTAADNRTAERDSDSDGLADRFEELIGSDAHHADTDNDGLTDGYEAVTTRTDPLSSDGDGDGQRDADELAAGTDPGRLPGIGGVIGAGIFAENVRRGYVDSDRDGFSDRMEKLVGTDPNSADTDRDKLEDATEAALGTDPTVPDSDHDGATDGIEVANNRNPLSSVLDSSGRALPTEAWTPEAAYQRRLGQRETPGGNQSAHDAPSTAPQFVPAGVASEAAPAVAISIELDRGSYGGMKLTSSMADVAARIAATTEEVGREQGWDEGMRRRASIIAIATAMKESTLGDDPATSRPNQDQDAGVFQQRVKPGWYGTLEQVNDVEYGTRAFLLGHKVEETVDGGAGEAGYRIPGLAQIKDWEKLSYSEASHKVQISAYPEIPARFIRMAEAVSDAAHEQMIAGPPKLTADDQPLDLARLPGAPSVDPDSDVDGLTDTFEKLAGTDPRKRDSDEDGVDDGAEALRSHTDPLSADSAGGGRPRTLPGTAGVIGSGAFAENVRSGFADADRDGVSNRTEKLLQLKTDGDDTDRDGLDDATELGIGTSPRILDSDGDGVADGYEVKHLLNPLDPSSNLEAGPGSNLGHLLGAPVDQLSQTPAETGEFTEAYADPSAFPG